MNINAAMVKALTIAAVTLPSALSAETVSKVILTPVYKLDAKSTYSLTVDDTGKWGSYRKFTALVNQQGNARIDNMRINNAVANRGVVYQLESTSNDNGGSQNEKWDIYRFTYAGQRLDVDPFISVSDCGHAKGLCVTPDGKYLFVGIYQSLNGNDKAGRIYRFDLSGEQSPSEPLLLAQFSPVGNRTQHITSDGNGFLYVADRGSSYVYKLSVEPAEDVYDDDNYVARSSCTAGNLQSVSYNPSDGCVYAGNWEEVYVFDAGTMEYEWQTKPSEMHQYVSSVFTGGRVYFGSGYDGCYPWSVDTSAEKLVQVTTDGSWDGRYSDYAYSAMDALRPWSAREWRFDEPAGAALCDGGVYLSGGARTGAVGVSSNALAFATATARAVIDGSASVLPPKGDFAFAFWANVPVSASEGVRSLVDNGAVAVKIVADGKVALSVGGASVTSSSAILDAHWHHIGVCRRGGMIELWLDGVRTAVALDAAAVITANDWALGCRCDEGGEFVGAGAFIDELVVYAEDYLPLYNDFVDASLQYAHGGAPEVPGEVERHMRTLDAAIGVEVARIPADEGAYYNTQLFKDGAVLYMSVQRGKAQLAPDTETFIYQSSDGGDHWTLHSRLAANAVSIYRYSGKLKAIGMVGDSAAKTWNYNEQEGMWEVFQSYESDEPFDMASGEVVKQMDVFARGIVFKGARALSGETTVGWVCFPCDDANWLERGPFVKTSAVEQESYREVSLVNRVLPAASMFADAIQIDGYDMVGLLYPLEDGVRPGCPRGEEHCFLQYAYNYWGGKYFTPAQQKSSRYVSLPGASKSFMVKKDPESGLYFALTVAVTNKMELETRPANRIRNRLALYSSQDFNDWTPCGVVAETGTADTFGYNAPSVTIDGDDLLIAVCVACEDNASGPRSVADGNYVAFKRVRNFRTAFVPQQAGKTCLYVCGNGSSDNTLAKYWLGEDDEWHGGKVIADHCGSSTETENYLYDGQKFGHPRSVAVVGNAVYVACVRSYASENLWQSADMRIFKFSRRNDRCLGSYVASTSLGLTGSHAVIAPSADGRFLYVVNDAQKTSVCKLDLATGNWSKFIDDSLNLNGVRTVAVARNGDVYTGNYSGADHAVRRWSPSGAFIDTVATIADGSVTSLQLDDTSTNLYVGDTAGHITKVCLSDGTATEIANINVRVVTPVHSLTWFRGKLVATASFGWVYEVDPSTAAYRGLIGYPRQATGVAAYEYIKQGFSIIVR